MLDSCQWQGISGRRNPCPITYANLLLQNHYKLAYFWKSNSHVKKHDMFASCHIGGCTSITQSQVEQQREKWKGPTFYREWSWTYAANFQQVPSRHKKSGSIELIGDKYVHFHLLLLRKLHTGHTHTRIWNKPLLKALNSKVCKRHCPDLWVPNEVLQEKWIQFDFVQAYHKELHDALA